MSCAAQAAEEQNKIERAKGQFKLDHPLLEELMPESWRQYHWIAANDALRNWMHGLHGAAAPAVEPPPGPPRPQTSPGLNAVPAGRFSSNYNWDHDFQEKLDREQAKAHRGGSVGGVGSGFAAIVEAIRDLHSTIKSQPSPATTPRLGPDPANTPRNSGLSNTNAGQR